MKYACLLALLTATACAPTLNDVSDSFGSGDDSTAIDENEQCDAADYRPLIGTPVTATIFPTGKLLRVYGQGDIVTQEYIPQRINVVYNSGGKIVRVTCG